MKYSIFKNLCLSCGFLVLFILAPSLGDITVLAQGKVLSPRGQAADKNKNGVIDRDEAGGPLKSNFEEMDCDKSGTLDGAEIRGFFSGDGCPKAKSKPKGSSQSRRTKTRAVRIDPVIKEPLSQTMPVIGRLISRKAGYVAARINGAIVLMSAAVGDRVKKGDLIAKIGRARLSAEREKHAAALSTRKAMVESAKAEYSKKKQELKRVANLRKSSAFSRAKYEDLMRDVDARGAILAERRSQLKEVHAELNKASIDLYNTSIRAPYDGIVSEKHTEVGAYVNIGSTVVKLISDIDIEVEAEVPSQRISGLRSGAIIRFQLDDGTRHKASVRSIVPEENARTRTRPVRFTPKFSTTTKPFAVNQTVTVFVPIGPISEVITVHKDAILYRGSDRVVSIVRRGRAFPRKIKIGAAVGNRFVLLKGLKVGDNVVTHGNETLPPGAAVHVLANPSPSRRVRKK
tara:strand:+ start:1099 stop:2472 length:1374 start_codon:yes stop_codon:yes gene_type:complete